METAEAAPGAHQQYRHHHRRRSHNDGPQQGSRDLLASAGSAPGLDVVRALHQTVVSLRTALDSSREELRKLKEDHQQQPVAKRRTSSPAGEIGRLALENHVLRRRLLDRAGEFTSDAATNPPDHTPKTPIKQQPPEAANMESDANETTEPKGEEGEEEEAVATEVEQQEVVVPKLKLSGQGASNESENESEELDDIELIFTTEETCRDVGLQEDLVSITDHPDNWQLQQQQQLTTPTPGEQEKSGVGQACRAKSEEGEPGSVCNGKANSVEEAASSQSSSIDREESVDRFDESTGSRLNKMWSQCSVLVETDISKCGVLEEIDVQARHSARRNTLAAPTATYRPIIHREALATGRRKSLGPVRPMMDRAAGGGLAESNGSGNARRESGAQTDISALPAQWRSESYLAHKVAHAFTTLPSKFALPAGVPGRLRLSDKTREARRVMLSDISFTSMVPELSRSADHLCQEPHNQFPQAHVCYGSRTGGGTSPGCCGGLRTPESSRRESWARMGGASGAMGLPSPSCDCRLSADLYPGRYRGSLSSIPRAPSAVELGGSRRHSWRPNNAGGSFDSWRGPAVLPGSHTSSAIVAACSPGGTSSCGGSTTGAHLLHHHHHHHHHNQHLARPTWSSMPSSPTHVKPPSGTIVARLVGSCQPRRTRSKVTFQECPMTRGSLPNLRSESLAETSGDSTESLIDEAEDYLRRSIDSMLTFSSSAAERCAALGGGRHSARRRRARRHSEPDLFREWNPPQDARPYLPKKPQDLKINHLVKVIAESGKILQGRVRYVGAVNGGNDAYVGVELPNNAGTSDGSYNGRRHFDCEAERAIFVPFKKVVLAWCTT
ncbi:uncharacterized protein LOC106638398 isoform X1 [Copidosoma floridanum]|uniref:uncharacterized protein LOC106638398 isoform X1 n=1 Tax=Copidosoma floridanum TaxID=29053 RepID=UPI0006C9BA12|nr:uncharacterized protein LOC106638398 isoform X1 [Copidosoma floridanum]